MSDPKKDAPPATPAPATPTKTVVLLVNNQERIEIMGIPGNETSFLGTELSSQKGRGLLPGVNFVDGAQLAECRKNKLFNDKFTAKIPKSLAREANSEIFGKVMLVQGREVPAENPLKPFPGEEALGLVEQINDEELVVLLIDAEARDDVRAKLRGRLTLLRTGTPQEDAA